MAVRPWASQPSRPHPRQPLFTGHERFRAYLVVPHSAQLSAEAYAISLHCILRENVFAFQAPPSRSSRASSYDPFSVGATRAPMSAPYRSDRLPYTRPTYSGMSHSYHDYSAPSRITNISRYGSTEQLHYKSPFTTNSSSGYGGGSSLYRSNPSFTRAGSVGFSMSDARREYTPTSSYSSSGSLSRYRPTFSSASTSSYQPRSSFDYRSKTPGYERDSRAAHYDRDTRSMSRTEKTPISEDDDVERTFQKLYDRYVKEDDSDNKNSEKKNNDKNRAKIRAFKSHSEAEEEVTSEEEQSPEEFDNSFAEKLRSVRRRADPSITPRGSNRNSPDATPKCSPLMIRKREEGVPILNKDKKPSEKKDAENVNICNKSPAEEFREKHSDVDFKPVVVPAATLKPATSAMDKLIRRDSLTTIDKKKSPTPALENGISRTERSKSNSPAPSRSVSPNPIPTTAKDSPVTSLASAKSASPKSPARASPAAPTKEATAKRLSPALVATVNQESTSTSANSTPSIAKASSPTPARSTTPSSAKNENAAAKKSPLQAAASKEPVRASPAPANKCTDARKTPVPTSVKKESTPTLVDPTATTDPKESPLRVSAKEKAPDKGTNNAVASKNEEKTSVPAKDPLPIIVTSSVENQEDRNSVRGQEPTAEFTISLNGKKKTPRSRSSSPARKSHRDHKESTPQFLTVDSKTPRKLDSQQQHHRMRHSASPSTTNIRYENGNSNEDEETGKGHRKRRDPTRTLENLKEKLEEKKTKSGEDGKTMKQSQDSTGSEDELKNRLKPPLLTVTDASAPSEPTMTTVQLWDESTDCDWTEAEDEADYESDFEYSVSQTFSLKDCMPIGDLYPLSRSSSRCSPFASDYDSDSSMPLFLLPLSRQEESRGRVDRLLANPPPTFTCSITYDGQESWDEESLHSCTDFSDEYFGRHSRFSRPSSSALGAYLSPTTYSSDEDYDGLHYHDEVDVGCTLRLVDKAAMRGDSDEDSEYYDDEEYSDEEYWDEEEEYDEEYDEEDEYEEEAEDEEEDEMHSFEESADDESRRSPYPLVVALPAEVEDDGMDLEEMEEEFEVEATFEVAEPKIIEKPEEKPEKHREVTYAKDLPLMTEEERAEQLRIEEEQAAKAIKKRVVKDGTSEKAGASRVPQHVEPAEENVALDESGALPEEEIFELDVHQHEDETGLPEVNVVPTYVRPSTEKVQEESASRFADKKVPTDFARKAVIQAPKLQTASVQKVETKIAPENSPVPPTSQKMVEKQLGKLPDGTRTDEEATKSGTTRKAAIGNAAEEVKAKAEAAKEKETEEEKLPKTSEDKSGARKSALNMTIEDAKKKVAADEEAAKQKARRLGTVSSLLNRFKTPEVKEEPITYKRSAYLEQKEKELERPKKKYNIVKPAINDDFDKQMEEIRKQMKSGSTQFQSHLQDLSKGITITSEEMRKRTEDEKHKMIIDSVSGAFVKADEEKARWKERRDAETEKELARIEAQKPGRKKVVVEESKKVPEKPAEPKRTVRKITKDKASGDGSGKTAAPAAPVPSFAVIPKVAAAPAAAKQSIQPSTSPAAPKVPNQAAAAAAAAAPGSAPATALKEQHVTGAARVAAPLSKPTSMEKPKIPRNDIVINEDNYDLFEAATAVATRGRKSLAEIRGRKEPTPSSAAETKEVAAATTKTGPKGDGATATKIRNALGNATNIRKTDSPSPKPGDSEKPAKRYATRRKTQEIVNASAEPKIKKRKQMYKRNRFIRNPHDIDVLLGWDKENTFEKMEQMFMVAAKERVNGSTHRKRKRAPASKIWISDLTDIDKIYKASEIRDIIASANDV
ncbi:hypothetical protein RB195_006169 [Necator americanus]|uniref:Uncharacterized protein n=1 Tax=Necator americanus TaxID=51031 RepID=A0ABR1BRA9_NECAM